MSNLVIIKPKPKSRSFTNINGTMSRVVEQLEDGNLKEKTLGTYNGEKFQVLNKLNEQLYGLIVKRNGC